MATVALNCAFNVTENGEKLTRIGFIIKKHPHGRRYSPELVAMCFMWLKPSTASYKLHFFYKNIVCKNIYLKIKNILGISP